MYLESIHLLNFRNWPELELQFEPGLNLITGPNGTGKTNILDAIYTLCLGKSYLSATDTGNIRQVQNSGETAPVFFMLEGRFLRNMQPEHIQCSVRAGSKKIIKRNKKEYERIADHVGRFPVVMIAPQDSRIIHDGSDERRRFMDALISQYDTAYLEDLMRYSRVIRQRNALLKQDPMSEHLEATLSVYDLQLQGPAERIMETRRKFINALSPIFAEHYARLSGEAEMPEIELSLSTGNLSFTEALHKSFYKDRQLRYTGCGPHRDDLEFYLNKLPVRKFASQGQQKTFLTALKLAEFSLLAEKTGLRPILLLDDIFDKLDPYRVGHLLVRVQNLGQVIITDTDSERLPELLENLGLNAHHIPLS